MLTDLTIDHDLAILSTLIKAHGPDGVLGLLARFADQRAGDTRLGAILCQRWRAWRAIYAEAQRMAQDI